MTEPEPEPPQQVPIKFKQLLPYLIGLGLGLPVVAAIAVGIGSLVLPPAVVAPILVIGWAAIVVSTYRRNRVVGLGLAWGTAAALVIFGSCIGLITAAVAQ